jgi:hypothetical protein
MSQITDIILSQWVIAAALGAFCIGLVVFCLVPALYLAARLRTMKTSLNVMRKDSAQLKAGIMTDVQALLERLTERQVGASNALAQSLQEFGQRQGASISQGVQEQMIMFAERLDQLLGGQVSQAKDLQLQTARSLETTVAAFQDMAKTMSASADHATRTMAEHLRANLSRSQAETDANLFELLGKLSSHVSGVISAFEQQAALSGRTAIEQQKRISDHAQRSLEALSNEVRSQTQAIDAAAQSMRSVGTDVASAVDRIVDGMTGLISGAAQEFMRSGQGFAEIFDKSTTLSRDLSETAAALAASSKDIGVVVADYRNARETLQAMVDVMRKVVEASQNDASLTGEVVERIESAAQKLISAQGQADEYLARLNGVLSDAHSAFSTQMLETVRDFHEHLLRMPEVQEQQQLSAEPQDRHSEFDRMISDWVQAAPRFTQTAGLVPVNDGGEEQPPAAPMLAGE